MRGNWIRLVTAAASVAALAGAVGLPATLVVGGQLRAPRLATPPTVSKTVVHAVPSATEPPPPQTQPQPQPAPRASQPAAPPAAEPPRVLAEVASDDEEGEDDSSDDSGEHGDKAAPPGQDKPGKAEDKGKDKHDGR